MSPLVALLALQAPPTLKVGDPAPSLAVSTWVKGTPIKDFEKGRITVVEFWATWCGPCKANMPHLSELARKLKGKVDVVSVDVWERPPADDESVKAFVASMGERMDYNVVRDDAKGSMSTNWMRAAGRNGIPSAFVVGRDGRIAWIGHPAVRMLEVLDALVADRFDPAAEAAVAAKLDADRKAQTDAILAYRKTTMAGDRVGAEKALAAYLTAHPEAAPSVATSKYQTLISVDEPAAYAYARELAAGLLKSDAQGLYLLSIVIVDSRMARLKNPDYALARSLAEQAAALPPSDVTPYVMTALAEAQAKLGERERALATLSAEVARLDRTKGVDPEAVGAVKAALAKMSER